MPALEKRVRPHEITEADAGGWRLGIDTVGKRR